MKINHKLALGFGIMALLIGVVGFITIAISKKTLEKSIANQTILLASETIDKIDREIFYRMEVIHSYISDLTLLDELKRSNDEFEKIEHIDKYIDEKDLEWRKTKKGEITPFIKNILSNRLSKELKSEIDFYKERHGHQIYSEIFITNKYGANVAQTGKTSDYRQNDEKWWQMAKEDNVYIMDFSFDESTKVYSILICVRIDDDNGEFLGVMKVVLNIAGVFNIFKKSEKESGNTYSSRHFYLISNEGEIIYSAHDDTFSERQDRALFSDIKSISKKRSFVRYEDEENGEGHYELISFAISKGYKDFKGLGWVLAVAYSEDEIFDSADKLKVKLIIISIILVVISLILSFFISRSISVPLLKLENATMEIGKGNIYKKIDLKTNDEIGSLTASFNKMIEFLQLTMVSKDYIDNILLNLSDMLIVLDKGLKIDMINPAVSNALKYKKEELIGQSITKIFKNNDNDSLNVLLNNLLKKNALGFNIEKIVSASDDDEISVLFSASQIVDNNGEVVSLVCTATDLSEQKQREDEILSVSDELIEKTKNLENSNIELKKATQGLIQAEKLTALGELTAGVAHELSQPLNGIKIVCQSVLRDIKKGCFEEGEIGSDLQDIVSQVNKMAEIIDHMRLFTRRSEGADTELTDINIIVESPFKLLGQQFKTHNINVVMELQKNLPQIKVNFIKMEQVFMNLLTNARNAVEEKDGSDKKIALKTYKVNKDESPIKVDSLVFEIIDSGTGIKEEVKNKIFQPFFTTKEPGKGTGLGLSVSFKIIEEHKGVIECNTTYGKGTSFKVFLPVG